MRAAILLLVLIGASLAIADPASAQDAPAPDAPAGSGEEDATPAGEPEKGDGETVAPPATNSSPFGLPSVKLSVGDEDGAGVGTALRIVLLLTVLTLAPRWSSR
jgi:hypothetical protein